MTDTTEQPLWRDPFFQKFMLIVLMVACAAAWINNFLKSEPPPVGVTVIATPAPEVKGQEKKPVAIKSGKVKAYTAPKNKAHLNLPQPVQDDPLQVVLESTQVKADDHPQTVTTTIDSDTGETKTYVRRDPLPWLAWDTHGEVGAYGGIKNGVLTARVEAKQGLVQIKALHLGVIASVDQPLSGPISADYYVGAGAWYRW